MLHAKFKRRTQFTWVETPMNAIDSVIPTTASLFTFVPFHSRIATVRSGGWLYTACTYISRFYIQFRAWLLLIPVFQMMLINVNLFPIIIRLRCICSYFNQGFHLQLYGGATEIMGIQSRSFKYTLPGCSTCISVIYNR